MHKLYASLRGIKLHNFSCHSRYYVYADGDDTYFSNVLLCDGDGKCYAYNFWAHESWFENIKFNLDVFYFEDEEI